MTDPPNVNRLRAPFTPETSLGPNRFATLNEARQLCPHLGIDPHLVLGQDADVLTQPIGLDRDIALQRLGDLVQHRAHVEVQRRSLVVDQQLAGKGEAEGLLPADSHRRQRVGFVGQPEPVPGVVVLQRGTLLVTQKVQIPATVRRDTPNSSMKSLLLGRDPLFGLSRTIWTMRRMR